MVNTTLNYVYMVAFMKILAYERIDISDGIYVNKSYESKECSPCHYWYFLDKSFSYGPYLCDGCYNMT